MKCEGREERLIDYIEGDLSDTEMKEFETHLQTCDICSQEAEELRETISHVQTGFGKIEVPEAFMTAVKERLKSFKESVVQSRRKKIPKIFLIALISLFLITTAFAGGGLKNLWADYIDQELANFNKNIAYGHGFPLNISDIDQNIKITITGVAADDTQTFLYYEIEDLNKEDLFNIGDWDGIEFINKENVWDLITPYPSPLKSKLSLNPFDIEDGYVYKGRLTLKAINHEEDHILIKINNLYNVRDMMVETSGEWYFEIPVTKHPSFTYEINQEVKIGDHIIIIERLITAPTTTVIEYKFASTDPWIKLKHVNIESIEVNKGIYPVVRGGSLRQSSSNQMLWEHGFINVQNIYYESADKITLHIDKLSLYNLDKQEYTIDYNKSFPQTFKYNGGKISIDHIEIGTPTQVEISAPYKKRRKFEDLTFEFFEGRYPIRSTSGGVTDGIMIDKNGRQYGFMDIYAHYSQMIEPIIRYPTNYKINLIDRRDESRELIPTGFEIKGYHTTEYVNKKVTFSIDKP